MGRVIYTSVHPKYLLSFNIGNYFNTVFSKTIFKLYLNKDIYFILRKAMLIICKKKQQKTEFLILEVNGVELG